MNAPNPSTMRSKTLPRYRMALLDIYLQCNKGTKFSVTELLRAHQVNVGIATILKEMQILTRVPRSGRPSLYTWEGCEPDDTLAREVCEQSSARSRQYVQEKEKTAPAASESLTEAVTDPVAIQLAQIQERLIEIEKILVELTT